MTASPVTPRPRRHRHLWQAYLWHRRLVNQRRAALQRIAAANAGRSDLDAEFERMMLEHLQIDRLIALAEREMVNHLRPLPVYRQHLRHIRGLKSGLLAAQLVATIDDITRYPTVSKLWRAAGMAVINGSAESKASRHVNRPLKDAIGQIAVQLVRQQTPIYADYYYAAKERDRRLHPEPECVGGIWRYSDRHIDLRARRKVGKLFLAHLWRAWHRLEQPQPAATAAESPAKPPAGVPA